MPNALARITDRAVKSIQGLSRRALGLGQFGGYGSGYGMGPGAPVLSGINVTPITALGLTAYYCGVNVISTDVAKLPLNLYRRKRQGGQAIATTDPRNRLVFSKPNDRMTSMRRRQAEMGHVLGWGNGYSVIERGPDGMPTALKPLHPSTLPIEINGALLYEEQLTRKRYRAEDVIHVAGLGFDGLTGYSPVALARQAIGLGIAVEQFGAALFGNGAIPKGALQTPKRLSEQAAKRLRETFHDTHGGTWNAHKTLVLEEGMTWTNTQIDPDDAQFLATRQFQVIEIARMLNLPPHKLGDYTAGLKANVEEGNLDYATSNLMGWCEAIEDEYNNKLLFDDERDRLFFQHDMSALMRGNSTARGAFYGSIFAVGGISPNEIRSREGMNPIDEPNADKCYLQAQYVPLDKAGEAMAAKQSGGTTSPDDPNADPGTEDPNADPEAKRFNPNHGKDGKFGAGHGGGGGGGSGDLPKDPAARAAELGKELADDVDPVGKLAKEVPDHLKEDGWEKDADDRFTDLIQQQDEDRDDHHAQQKEDLTDFKREQKDDAREFVRDQKDAVKEQERDQKQEIKDLEHDQKSELKSAQKDGDSEADIKDLKDAHKGETHDQIDQHDSDREALQKDQVLERETFVKNQKEAHSDFLAGQKEDTETLLAGQREHRAEFIKDLAEEMFEIAADIQDEGSNE